MFKPILILGVSLLLCGAAVGGPGGKRTDRTSGYREVSIPMPDGVALGTDVFIPRGSQRCPAVLVRTPYGKSAERWMGKAFNLFGVAVVVQDVRGKYGSKGEYYPFRNERADGLQTLRWIRSQPWSDGKVAGWGGSYVGYTQWAISDSLDFLVPLLTGANLYDLVYPDGVFSLQTAFWWGFVNASGSQNNLPVPKLLAAMKILPLGSADDSTIAEIPYETDWMTHETEDAYWKSFNHRGITHAPLISVAGWYDIFLQAQLRDFQAAASRNDPDSRMVIGPWCHGSQGVKMEYGGLKKSGDPKALLGYTLRVLKGKPGKLPKPFTGAKYNLFIMERNEYVGSDVWPPRETTPVPYYPGPGGRIGPEPAREGGSLSWVHDPLDPYPSHGGTALGDGVGPALQDANRNRTDQLAFESEPLVEPLVLLGEITASLWVSSEAPCTQFTVSVEDIFPDGKTVNIQEGAANVRLSGSGAEKKEISLWATGYQLNPGHRLRVVVASAWFPRFARSLNTCETLIDGRSPVKARQTLWYGPGHPSCIYLPVYQPVKD